MADGPAARRECLEQRGARQPERPVHPTASMALGLDHARLLPVGRVDEESVSDPRGMGEQPARARRGGELVDTEDASNRP